LRHDFYGLGCCLPLLRVAGKTTDAFVLAPHVGSPEEPWMARSGRHVEGRRNTRRATDLYRQAVATSLVDAPAHFLGMRPGGSDHVSAGLRVGIFPVGTE